MDSFHTQREYGAAVEAHYGLKNVTKVSMPTNEHDEPLVMHISMLVSKEDIKGIAARFAGDVPAETPDRNRIVLLSSAYATAHQMMGAKVHEDKHAVEVRYSNLSRDQLVRTPPVWREAPPKTSIGEFTVKLDASLVQDAIREMLEPGAMYLPASAVEWLARGVRERLVELGGVAADQAADGGSWFVDGKPFPSDNVAK